MDREIDWKTEADGDIHKHTRRKTEDRQIYMPIKIENDG